MDIATDTDYLHRPTEWVKINEDDITEVVANLFEELEARKICVGLSANQLHYPLRIFVMRNEPFPPICLVNPVITKIKGGQALMETCLSLPKVGPLRISRPMQIVVKGYNQYYFPVKYRFTGLKARIVCHEVDHLAGKLITDVVPIEDKELSEDEQEAIRKSSEAIEESSIENEEPTEKTEELLERMKRLRGG